LATVAHTWGSSPRQPGALMVLNENAHFEGSVSGGCIEEELIERIRSRFPDHIETIEYSSDTSRTLPCGGRLLLVLEPLAAMAGAADLVEALRSGQRIVRSIDLNRQTASWSIADAGASTEFTGEVLSVVYEPAWRLMVVGAGELASWVCRFAAQLGYAVDVCDPRTEYREAWNLGDFEVAADYPDDHIAGARCDEQTAIVALTHDPKVDDLAMIEALRTRAFYIGALGSSRTTQRRAERLIEHFAASEADIARIRGPIGIDLNTRRPQEIALAVMVDITAARNGVEIVARRRSA
jgi:xanthine dehydrogenase accessory factor